MEKQQHAEEKEETVSNTSEYSSIPDGMMGVKLEYLARILGPHNIGFAGREIEKIAIKLAPETTSKIEGNEMCKQENMLLQELCTDMPLENDMEDIITDIFEMLSQNAATIRNQMLDIMDKFRHTQATEFGNRLMMLADIMKGARQICLSKTELNLFVRFAVSELGKMSAKIGNDY